MKADLSYSYSVYRIKLPILILFSFFAITAYSQEKVYFVDGYHGGIYGHYPVQWKTQFMVDKLEQHPEWKMCIEIEPETWDTVQARTPQAYEDFKRIATNSRVDFTNPTYAQPYSYNISGESLIRQFQYGIRKIHQHFPDVKFHTYAAEEPCFTSCLPQLLKQFGFKYAVLKCPNTCWGGYTQAYGGELVNWMAPDGTSILTVPRYACEELEDNSTWQTKAWNNSEAYLQACSEAGIQHPVGMCFQDAGWNNGPWLGTGDNIKNNSIYVTWTDYIENISVGKTDDNWHFSQEDMLVNLMWGSQVLQKIAQEVRTAENNLVTAEKIGTMMHLTGNYTYNQQQLDEAWRTLLMAQHHDSWIVPYNRLNKQRTWAEEITLWTKNSNQTAQEIIIEALHDDSQQEASPKESYVRVFNTLAVERTGITNLILPPPYTKNSQIAIYDSQGNPAQFATEEIGERIHLFIKATVPPFGYETYRIANKKTGKKNVLGITFTSASECVMENSNYRIVFDASKGGTIKSLVAKKEGNKEFAAANQEFALGELRGHFYEENRFHSSTHAPATITVLRDNALEKSVKIIGTIAGHPFTQIVTLQEGQKQIDFDLQINWKGNVGIGEYKQGNNWRENRRAFCDDRFKLNVLFPTTLEQPKLYKNAPFDVCESRLHNTYFNTWDGIKHNIILHWIDLAEDKEKNEGYSLALLSDHTTSYSYGEDFPLGLTAQYSGIGLWGPDYKITRPLHMKYALIPHRGKWDDAAISTQSSNWNEPLLCNWYAAAALENRSLIDARHTGYEITAATIQDDGILLRLFNAEGNDAAQKISFGFPVASVSEVDLNGRLVEEKQVTSQFSRSEITVSMPRFGLKTFLVKRKTADVPPPSHYVNPFIGASTSIGDAGVYHGLGKTFPGATTPYGMVQVSPNTITGGDNSPGYSYEHQTIEGFAFTQMSGVGWFGDLGNFLVMPTTGPLKKIAGKEDGTIEGYRSAYDKQTETARAGYYSAELTDYGIRAESTATPHCGMLRFTFPQHQQSRIQIDLARKVGGTSTAQYIKVVDNRTIQGWMKCPPEGGGWGNGEGNTNYVVYFYAEFSKPMQDYGFWSADIPDDWTRKKGEVVSIPYLTRVSEAPVIRGKNELEGKHLGFFTEFQTHRQEEVTLKVGISFVDMEGARNNFEAEVADRSFDDVQQSAAQAWDKELSRIRIAGGTEDEKTVFYTALYHTMIDPRIYMDVDGRYTGGDGHIHQADGAFTKRTIFSGWDVFRSQFPLQTIINPALVGDQLNSLITLAQESGREYYERWEILNAYSGCMIGNPALSVLADAYVKGIRTYDAEKAYRFAKNTSARFGNDELGYTASDFSISHTLEYAYFDWCIAQMAAAMGKEEDAGQFRRKGQAYRNIFDREKGWFRPRKADGSWQAWPQDARIREWYGCIESNPYQQGWFVPHDVDGMVELMGGREAVLADLAEFFDKTPQNLLWNNYYNHANEPVHFVPFLFNQLGEPWNTQKWSRYICKNAYRNEVEGIVGNEDAGQMSAWYVLAASGIHPSCPGDTRVEITSPIFNKIAFQLDANYAHGKVFTIIAHNNTPANIYIQRATLNGKEHDKCYIDFADIASGGVLELYMGSEPNTNWGK